MSDDAPIRRITHRGLTIEGYARAAVQSYWRIEEFEVGFDLGGQPLSFASTATWFVSHCHLDHIAALPQYVARRRRLRLAPPTVYLPQAGLSATGQLLAAWQKLDGSRMPCELVGLSAGDEVSLAANRRVKCLQTQHTVPSLGYVIYDRSPESPSSVGTACQQVDANDESPATKPIVCYTGDTAPEGLDNNPEVFESQILITEMSFVDPRHRRDRIHKYGHLHLDDFIARQQCFQNELIIAGHLTARSTAAQARRAVEQRLPAELRNRFHVWV